MERYNNYFSRYRVNKTLFVFLTLNLTFGKNKLPEGFHVCVNYELNLLDHVGIVAKAVGVRQAIFQYL